MKNIAFGILATLLLSVTLYSCKKTCAECPAGTELSVDEPKEKNCICCPTGETYNQTKGYCE